MSIEHGIVPATAANQVAIAPANIDEQRRKALQIINHERGDQGMTESREGELLPAFHTRPNVVLPATQYQQAYRQQVTTQ